MNRRNFLNQCGLAAMAAGISQSLMAEGPLPKICCLGDSIRMGYAPFVAQALQGTATLFSPTENGGDTINMLKYLHLWVQREQPAIVHLNCGLHDLKTLAYGAKSDYNLVPVHQYQENIGRIFSFIRSFSKAHIIWATTTPINEKQAHENHAQWQDFDRYESSVLAYNEMAVKVCRKMKVPVNDLYQFCLKENLAALRSSDGVHFTEAGSQKLGLEVARIIRERLKNQF